MIDISRHPTDIFIDLLRTANPSLPPLTKEDISTRNLTSLIPPTAEVDVDLLIQPSDVDGDYVIFEYDRVEVDTLFSAIDQDAAVGSQRLHDTNKQSDFTSSVGLPVIEQDLYLYLLTKYGLNVGSEAKLIAHTEPDSYRLEFDGLVYTGAIEFLPRYNMSEPTVLLQDGIRFSHKAGTASPASPADMAGWSLTPTSDAVLFDGTPTTFTGILSPRSAVNYNFVTTVNHAMSDEDPFGNVTNYIILAYFKDVNGVEHTLSLGMTRGISAEYYEIVIDLGTDRSVLVDTIYSSVIAWERTDITERTVQITRNSNKFRVVVSKVPGEPPEPINTTINLDDIPNSTPFYNKCRFGYAVNDPGIATFKDIPL